MTPEQEFRKLFNDRMDRLEQSHADAIQRLEGKIDGVHSEMSTLKVKVAGFASFIGSGFTLLISYLKG